MLGVVRVLGWFGLRFCAMCLGSCGLWFGWGELFGSDIFCLFVCVLFTLIRDLLVLAFVLIWRDDCFHGCGLANAFSFQVVYCL